MKDNNQQIVQSIKKTTRRLLKELYPSINTYPLEPPKDSLRGVLEDLKQEGIDIPAEEEFLIEIIFKWRWEIEVDRLRKLS